MRSEAADIRVRLAARILVRMACGGRPPILLSEIAELRFYAESDEELALPLDELARTVIDRERARMGFPPPGAYLRPSGRN